MRIEEVLHRNLDALMERHPTYRTQGTLGAAAKVGQTSVGRMRRGEGSATIGNVAAVARAFHLSAADLLDPQLLSRKGLGTSDSRQRAFELAERIRLANLAPHQLAILANTLDALLSALPPDAPHIDKLSTETADFADPPTARRRRTHAG